MLFVPSVAKISGVLDPCSSVVKNPFSNRIENENEKEYENDPPSSRVAGLRWTWCAGARYAMSSGMTWPPNWLSCLKRPAW